MLTRCLHRYFLASTKPETCLPREKIGRAKLLYARFHGRRVLKGMKIDMKVGTRILAGYGVALLVVSGIGVVAYHATVELIEGDNLVTHTHKVKEALSQV